MCRRVECRKCGKPTWAGCGAHVEQVLGNIPSAERCQCREAPVKKGASDRPPTTTSWLSRLLGS
jgi:hypothetical protein